MHDTVCGISTSGCQEEDHCLPVENLILQHVSPAKLIQCLYLDSQSMNIAMS